MSRTVRTQSEWSLHRALDDMAPEGDQAPSTDDIVVMSTEGRIILSQDQSESNETVTACVDPTQHSGP